MKKLILAATMALLIVPFICVPVIAGDKTNKTSKVKVGKFYDGQEGYFLSIPTGNQSRCVWVWAGGTASAPDMQVTSARTATEKHAIRFPDMSWLNHFKVYCVDDFGNLYEGSFPK
ncbi:MAG: hypothetical protein ABSF90_07790 [Syntrophobacteraceae bacterium]|jgi:hypothetical protein